MMKPSEDDYTCNTLATSPSKETSRPHRSRPILHLFLEREDVTSAISMDKQTTSTRDDLSSKGQTSKDSDYLPHGESIIQKFRPMLQSFFERESERKLNAARPTMLGKDSETKGSSLESVASSHSTKNSTRTSDDDNDSVWRSYRRDTLSRNGSGDHSNNEHLATTLRRRSSLGVAASVTSDVSLSLGSLNDKTEIEKSNSASRGMSHPEQRKSRWYKNKFFLIPACFVVIVVFCLFSAIPLVKRKNSSSTNTSFTYTNQQTDGTSVTVGSTSSPHMHPSKQPSSGNVVISGKSTVPTSKPVSTKSSLTNPTKTPVSNPTKFPIAYPTKAPVVVPTKAPVLNPTTVTPPSSVQSSATDCFLTSEVTCTDALNPAISCATLISNWKNKGSTPCVSVNIRYNFRICNVQTDTSALLKFATGKVNGIQTTDLTLLGKNTVMNPRECRSDFRTWSGTVFCYNGLIQNQTYASLWIQGINNKGSNCTDFNKFIYSSI